MNDFDERVRGIFPGGLQSQEIDALQINIGRHCNLACAHCHLECSPARTEMMSWRMMEEILELTKEEVFRLVDITGGSPELHPNFMRFISALRNRDQSVQIRTNLTALMESSANEIIPFLKERAVGLVGSLPCYTEENVDTQRGTGVYQKSIKALRLLNEAGYGIDNQLSLILAYNPGEDFLPPDQFSLEEVYREELKARFNISFSKLIVLTNMPLGRFRRYLERNEATEIYLSMLKRAFNPATIAGLMCRYQLSVDWDGTLYDCDFNLALGMTVNHTAPNRIESFDRTLLAKRLIVTGAHCFGCTAGAGSSCSGSWLACNQEDPEKNPS
jgi:radical SAM/Cys-rich protein